MNANDEEANLNDSVELLFERYGPLVYRRCLKLLKVEEMAREASQDTFVRLLTGQKTITSENHAGLLYRIATNVCLNIIKKESRKGRSTDFDSLLVEIAGSDNVESKLLSSNFLEVIFSKEKESTAVLATLYFLDGMTYEEISEETGMSVSGIRKRLRLLKDKVDKLEERTNVTRI